MKNSVRQTIRESQQKKRKSQNILKIGLATLGILVIAIFIFSALNSNNPDGLMGQAVVVASAAHVADSVQPGPYNSNPPAGGTHYEESYAAKFYQESDLPSLPKYPEGYLVHSLEHGYVIFWYNCQVAGTNCAALKQTIQDVMQKTGGDKLIAFPWSSMDVPLAMTSWGRLLNFTEPEPDLMEKFVKANRYQAPEPNAQ